jgi:hypothetical protein
MRRKKLRVPGQGQKQQSLRQSKLAVFRVGDRYEPSEVYLLRLVRNQLGLDSITFICSCDLLEKVGPILVLHGYDIVTVMLHSFNSTFSKNCKPWKIQYPEASQRSAARSSFGSGEESREGAPGRSCYTLSITRKHILRSVSAQLYRVPTRRAPLLRWCAPQNMLSGYR